MDKENLTKEEKEKIERYQKEIKKYLEEKSPKKPYTLYLTIKDVEIVKNHIKVPLSKMADDFIKMMSISIQEIEKRKKVKEEKNEGEKKEINTGK